MAAPNQTFPRHRASIILGAGIIIATYAYLVLLRPEGLPDGTGTASVIALVGNIAGALLLLAGVIHRLPLTTVALIPSAIALNIVMGQITSQLGINLYLDSLGTVLVGALAGPAAGIAAGVLGNVVWGVTLAPVATAFASVAALTGAIAGYMARAGLFRRVWTAPIAGALTGVVTALVAAPIAAFAFGGTTGGGATAAVAALRAMGSSLLQATTLQGLMFDPLDKAIIFTVAALILAALPQRILAQFGPPPTRQPARSPDTVRG
ncbi:histidine kinase [Lolliginicoccus suaedae]|uniref:histidine kinase n=1 Tax=Lolliginicoccus suaedae TaxID=2605429 RepID=UPI001659C9A7|nr:histidine kinase [Lolliginicoccus suaedae]